ncbi:MAG: hypothetical protein EA378_00820 [Phycisphaerales bacterium]|nr:MAG: hypothetical protein EA378_00820 [Phycisphaerales bacterium]
MGKRSDGPAATEGVPPPPLRVRIHKEAPPRDGHYRDLHRRLEEVGWFRHAVRNLGGLASAARRSEHAANELGIEPVDAGGVRFMRATIDGLCVMFWISESTSTVYVLHSLIAGLLGRLPRSAEMIAARRCKACMQLDARRTRGRKEGER